MLALTRWRRPRAPQVEKQWFRDQLAAAGDHDAVRAQLEHAEFGMNGPLAIDQETEARCINGVPQRMAREPDECHDSGPLSEEAAAFRERPQDNLTGYGGDCIGDNVIEKIRSYGAKRQRGKACAYMLGRFGSTEFPRIPGP